MHTILDCYTDEPSGLGVPPYIGTYPRYIAGALNKDVYYITIDDLRLHVLYKDKIKKTAKTNVKIKNISKNYCKIDKILSKTRNLIIIAGIQTPGKYLGAVPATLREIRALTKGLNCKKILTGPAGSIHGTRLHGGKFAEKVYLDEFDIVDDNYLEINNYEKIKDYAVRGASIVKQHPDFPSTVAEIETYRGCNWSGCSFCVEPSKKVAFREQKDILKEIKMLYSFGIRHFRFGKQSCFYSYKNGNPDEIEKLLKIRKSCPEIKVLHIDNVNPAFISENKEATKITKLIIKYCTAGNVAAFGVESFDEKVIKANNLNAMPEQVFEAVKLLNKYGSKKGSNGMPCFLPGINLLFGLNKESKNTHYENMFWLKKILDKNLWLRRINIRQVVLLPETSLFKFVKNKYIRKNKRYYWSWRNEIRQNIDYPMLQRIVPKETVLKELRTEIYDGNTTFCRQLGTYPLIVGVKKRLELNKFINIKVTGYMLRSIIGEQLNQ